MNSPLLGDGVDQAAAWKEFLREVAEAAAGEFLAVSGTVCRIDAFHPAHESEACTRGFRLSSPGGSWTILVCDEVHCAAERRYADADSSGRRAMLCHRHSSAPASSCCSMLNLRPHFDLAAARCLSERFSSSAPATWWNWIVTSPIRSIWSSETRLLPAAKWCWSTANFGLRVTEVAAPQKAPGEHTMSLLRHRVGHRFQKRMQ